MLTSGLISRREQRRARFVPVFFDKDVFALVSLIKFLACFEKNVRRISPADVLVFPINAAVA